MVVTVPCISVLQPSCQWSPSRHIARGWGAAPSLHSLPRRQRLARVPETSQPHTTAIVFSPKTSSAYSAPCGLYPHAPMLDFCSCKEAHAMRHSFYSSVDLFWRVGWAFVYSVPLVLQLLHSAWTSTTTQALWQLTLEVSHLHLCLRPLDTKNQNGLSKIDI
jgi:hypothetical protein